MGCGKTQAKRLQKPQNRAARIILNVNNNVSQRTALHALSHSIGNEQ